MQSYEKKPTPVRILQKYNDYFPIITANDWFPIKFKRETSHDV